MAATPGAITAGEARDLVACRLPWLKVSAADFVSQARRFDAAGDAREMKEAATGAALRPEQYGEDQRKTQGTGGNDNCKEGTIIHAPT
jgi:hypothetical protein